MWMKRLRQQVLPNAMCLLCFGLGRSASGDGVVLPEAELQLQLNRGAKTPMAVRVTHSNLFKEVMLWQGKARSCPAADRVPRSLSIVNPRVGAFPHSNLHGTVFWDSVLRRRFRPRNLLYPSGQSQSW